MVHGTTYHILPWALEQAYLPFKIIQGTEKLNSLVAKSIPKGKPKMRGTSLQWMAKPIIGSVSAFIEKPSTLDCHCLTSWLTRVLEPSRGLSQWVTGRIGNSGIPSSCLDDGLWQECPMEPVQDFMHMAAGGAAGTQILCGIPGPLWACTVKLCQSCSGSAFAGSDTNALQCS